MVAGRRRHRQEVSPRPDGSPASAARSSGGQGGRYRGTVDDEPLPAAEAGTPDAPAQGGAEAAPGPEGSAGGDAPSTSGGALAADAEAGSGEAVDEAADTDEGGNAREVSGASAGLVDHEDPGGSAGEFPEAADPGGEDGAEGGADEIDGDAAGDDEDADLGELSDDQVGGRRNALPRRMESWRSRSATGAIATAMAMGLQQVFEPERRRPAAVAEAPSDPYNENDPVTVDYVPDDAEGTRVHVKPWLLQKEDPA